MKGLYKLKKTRFLGMIIGFLGITMINPQVDARTLEILMFQQDSSKVDSSKLDKKKISKLPLPLKAERTIKFNTKEATWTSLDVSPDGQTILFDLLGDIYEMPITGGKAKKVTKGMAFDTHPRYSPDGKKIVFTSDRSGSENIWVLHREKEDTIQVTKGKNQNYPAATWTPDGEYIIASKGRRIAQLWMFHWKGGGGIQLIKEPRNRKTIDPFVSPDGRYIYFSWRTGSWNYNAQLPQYQVGMYDRENGKVSRISNRYGSAFTPTLSKDGQWMVYGTRYEDQTGLMLRNLSTGDEKWLAYPVQRDEQESIATMGVLPGMAFTPDSKFLLASYGGKVFKIPVMGGDAQEIPLDVDVELEMGPRLQFKYPIKDDEKVLATQIRDAVPSPDGKKLAFTVLNRLYVMAFPNGEARRLTDADYTEAQPAWSPDGNNLVYTTWTPNGGHLYKVNVNGKARPIKLTNKAAIYQNPAWSENNRIVFSCGTAQTYKDAIGPFAFNSNEKLCWIPASGGAMTQIDRSYGRSYPHFVKGQTDRIYLNSRGGLISIRWDGTDEKRHVEVTGITTFGTAKDFQHSHDFEDEMSMPLNYCMLPEHMEEGQERNLPSRASLLKMAPVGNYAMAQINNEIYVVNVPKAGKTPKISVSNPKSSAFPSRKLTEIGGQFPAWSSNGNQVHWSIGRAHFVYDLREAEVFDDSVKIAKREAAKKKAEAAKKKKEEMEKKKEGGDDGTIGEDEKEKAKEKKKAKEKAKFKAKEYEVKVYYKKDVPQGRVLLKGARLITMKGEEVIEKGDILVENARIKSVGPSGSLEVPASTKEIDLNGKTVVPGFVDTHAHMWPNWNIHKNQIWIYAANLAYGVTTTRDPQTATTDVLTYADMVEAGMMPGPRVYSTGPGVGFWAYNLKSYEQTEQVLKQYSKYYNTKTIKMYLTGNRQQRQWIIMAAKEQELMPTTEGGLDYKLNLTQLIDGYPGHEHAIPVHPIYNDLVKTIAESKMCVTPTLLVAYGGPWAENYFYATEQPYNDKKLQYFTPYRELAAKSRRRGSWFMPEEHVFQKHAEFIKDLVAEGGLSGVGSHGQLQGLGYHWELWAMQAGGMNNFDALKTATILGAEAIGLDKDLGSIESGKLADLVILDQNPLDNIRNTNQIRYVMKNGSLYDGNNLDEVHPLSKKAKAFDWHSPKPENLPGIKK